MNEYSVLIDVDYRNGDRRWMESDSGFTSRSEAIDFAEGFASLLPAKGAKIVDDDGDVVWDAERESRHYWE